MPRTIGTKRPRNSPIGDFETMCSDCGAAYLRSRLEKDEDGQLRCRDCGKERCEVELNRGNAMGARRPKRTTQPRDGGNWDHLFDPFPEIDI